MVLALISYPRKFPTRKSESAEQLEEPLDVRMRTHRKHTRMYIMHTSGRRRCWQWSSAHAKCHLGGCREMVSPCFLKRMWQPLSAPQGLMGLKALGPRRLALYIFFSTPTRLHHDQQNWLRRQQGGLFTHTHTHTHTYTHIRRHIPVHTDTRSSCTRKVFVHQSAILRNRSNYRVNCISGFCLKCVYCVFLCVMV